MSKRILSAICRKALGLILISNSIASLLSALNVLYGAYLNALIQFHEAYVVNELLFIFLALTSILNLAPAKALGKIEIRRFLFHHYVYGFILIFLYFTSALLFSIMQPWVWDVQAYMSLLFCWGAALIIDDIYDVSPKIAFLLDAAARIIRRLGWLILIIHAISSLFSAYVAFQILAWNIENILLLGINPFLSPIRIFLVTNLFITAFYGLKIVKDRVWLMNSRSEG
jgi:hypothetical protein